MREAARIVLLSLTVLTLTIGCIAALAGCRDAMATPARCEQYPIPWRPADGAQAAAQAELASLSPGASMTWNSSTGTLASVFQLATPLPGCTDGQDAVAQVFDVIAAHPALFQLEPTEWQLPEPFDCKYVGSDAILNMGRRRLAGQPVAEDVFAYGLNRIDGVVYLTFVAGTYLPVIGTAMGNTMAACNNLTAADAKAIARNTSLKATVFSQCRRTGTVSYTPKSNDAFRFASEEAWSWQEDTDHVLMTGHRTLRVIVAPANYTPELLSSDARCPVPGGNGRAFNIGFDIAFDVHTGAIDSVKPGLDCIVC